MKKKQKGKLCRKTTRPPPPPPTKTTEIDININKEFDEEYQADSNDLKESSEYSDWDSKNYTMDNPDYIGWALFREKLKEDVCHNCFRKIKDVNLGIAKTETCVICY